MTMILSNSMRHTTELSKDNGPASKEPIDTHNECMLHFYKFQKVL